MKRNRFIITLIGVGLLGSANTIFADEPIEPIPPVKEINLAQVELGKKLFFDPRLSKSGVISCNSCHNLSMGGTDNLKTSIGHNWKQGPINSPTVLNASMNIAQFWDGRAADVEDQAKGPPLNPIEMAIATPAIFPKPTVAERAVVSAWKCDTSPGSLGSS